MNLVKSLLLATCTLAIFTNSAGKAASFDCAKAATKIEMLVCEDITLSLKDEQLATSFAQALIESKNAARLRQQQREWLASVRNRCTDVGCLRSAYDSRLENLGRIIHASRSPACTGVVDHATRNALHVLDVPANGYVDREAFGKIFAQEKYEDWSTSPQYWNLDFDEDSIADHLLISYVSRLEPQKALASSGKVPSYVTILDDSDERRFELSVVKVAGRLYVLSLDMERRLDRLWRYSDHFNPICRFTLSAAPADTTISGKQVGVCSEIRSGATQAVEFRLKHTATTDPRMPGTGIPGGLALIDIDNDSIPDPVVRIEYWSTVSYCSSEYLAMTDASWSRVSDSHLNNLPGTGCGGKVEIYSIGGINYTSVLDSSGKRVVYLTRIGKTQAVCEMRERAYLIDTQG